MKPVFFIVAFFMGSMLSFAGNKLISAEKVHSLSREELMERFRQMKVPSVIMEVTNGIDVYELMYVSSFPDGREVKASGILFVPTGVDKPLPLMVYHHGTRLRKQRKIDLTGEQFICSAFAGDGYIVAWPDYFGIGKGDGFHPYQHAETEAQASMDMIRASREFLDELGVKRNEQLFLTGYSQGGHAAMSAHKFMQERHPDEFKITASAPMSGAYDMTGVQSEVMFQPYEYPMYLPYILLGYYEVYKYNPLPSKLMRAPYDTLIPRIFNGINDFGDVNSLLPEIPGDIFTDEVIQRYRSNDTTFHLRKLLEDNNVYDWKPESPMMLCYCKADEQVTYKNSLVAYKAMKKRGTKHLKKTHAGPKFDHNTCAIYASVYTKYFFDSFRKGSKYGRRGNSWKRFLLDLSKMSVNKQMRKARKEKERKAAEAEAGKNR